MTDPKFGPDAGSNPGEGVPPPPEQQPSYPPPGPGYPPPDYGQYPPPPPGYGQYPPPPPEFGQYPPPPPGYGQYPPPPPGVYVDPTAPYGRHPVTGEPLSEKSKTIAGLLQLLGLFGLLGIGRMYLGQVGLGVAQLVGGIIFTAVTCGFGVLLPMIWGIVDAVMIFTDKVRDPQGRPLRDGT
ncbi:TM2 domain-containing protein [Mycolicibacterium mengxianglii]|uniref:NINE protein n=1 Tax=Mycolicibacterium mengxianglii TaxID=2736649 RepID=UPI0018EF243C|nr:NINE protein [Mycolicibacterium mengxianglii]